MSDHWTDTQAGEDERLYERRLADLTRLAAMPGIDAKIAELAGLVGDDAKVADIAKLAKTVPALKLDVASEKSSRPFVRRPLGQVSPKRSAGGFYRTADGKTNALGGVPLVKMEDAVTAAVRMAYKVAAAQVERSSRLAKRLRDAGDRAAGPDSDRKALDATERLVFRSMMSGLTWLETAAAERDSPLKRLLAAEVRLLGSMLGLEMSPGGSHKDTPAPTEEAAPRRRASRAASEAAEPPPRVSREVNIVHLGADRPVRVTELDLGGLSPPGAALAFYSVNSVRSTPIKGELEVKGRRDITLYLTTPRNAPAGRWQAAICDSNKRQLGFIEILL